ncbi:MAG: hypothetical protein CMK59_04645 [Proteobacteria bacterium]|nr:hypothetical protein [Pseudomonadota bacterium]
MNWLFGLTMLFIGCTQNASDTVISLQLNWTPEAEHGGYYQALEEGYYKEEGLDVEIRSGGSGVRVETETALQRSHFGITNADKLLSVREKGLKIIALLAPFQSSPRVLIHHKSNPISSFEDLSKAKLLILNNTKPFYRFLVNKYPKLKNIDTIPYNKAVFMENKQSVMQGYVNAEPLVFNKKGLPVEVLKLSEIGFNPYASLLICSEDLLKERPELVQKMQQASIKGWLKYLEDPTKGNKAITKLNPSLTDHITESANQLPPLMKSDSHFGDMKLERFEELAEQLIKVGVLEKKPAYDNLFLNP